MIPAPSPLPAPAKPRSAAPTAPRRNLPESQLFAPVRDWLVAQGYTVFAEVRGADVVAIRDEHLVVVELKTSFTHRLMCQASTASLYADAAYAAVPSMPRKSSLDSCAAYGFGILVVGESVKVIKPPVESACRWPRRRELVLNHVLRSTPDNRVGGVPNMAGDGDAQRTLRLVDAYLAANPDAKWKDIFRDVPNHYAHHSSMRQGIAAARERQERQSRRAGAS